MARSLPPFSNFARSRASFTAPCRNATNPHPAAPAGNGGEGILAFPGMTDTSTLVEHAPYVLLIIASLIIGFMPFLLIKVVEPSVSLLPFIK